MNSEADRITRRTSTVRFWEGMEAEVDLRAISDSAVPVKGVSYHSPLRFLQIYGETSVLAGSTEANNAASNAIHGAHPYAWETIEKHFLPRIPSVDVRLDETTFQPPYPWRDADPSFLCVSCTYITNAIFRILNVLVAEGRIAPGEVEPLLDRTCLLLARIYTARNHFLIKNINNNLNYFFIAKAVEYVVGKRCYNSERQEVQATRTALKTAISMVPEHQTLEITEKMGIALGKGVSFIESRLRREELGKRDSREVRETAYRYFNSRLAIDHRNELLAMIANGGQTKNCFLLAVILDDTTESVDDLLWLTDLMQQFPFLQVHLLVNTAQISINFSSGMLRSILRAECFRELASMLGSQFFVTEMYCPLISFQTDFLPPHARDVIDRSDAIYIKGANFFETCQIPEKHTFHAFVVFGPISRTYTGLDDFSAVFVHLTPGTAGYRHSRKAEEIVTLRTIASGASGCAPYILNGPIITCGSSDLDR